MKRSCEHLERVYVPFMGHRLVFDLSYRFGKRFVGWYRP